MVQGRKSNVWGFTNPNFNEAANKHIVIFWEKPQSFELENNST